MIRPWPALRINWLGRYRWTCIGIVCLCMAVLIAATAVAQAPSDLLKKDGPVADQEPITPIPAPPDAAIKSGRALGLQRCPPNGAAMARPRARIALFRSHGSPPPGGRACARR